MKLHLPSSLRSALLSCLSVAFVLTTGSGVLQAGEQELTFNGATLNWTTAPENQVFTAADSSPAAFAPGDNVYFTGTTQVTLGEDIAMGILGVEAGAHVNITPGAYALEAERIELSGTLDYGSALHIGEGQTLAVEGAGSVLDSALVLQDNGAIEVAAVANLNNNSLSMQGGTALSLSTTGDGRVYNLFTGVSSLLDAQGNTLVLNTTNNAVSNYFDTTRPGTGFWAGATLQLTTDGTLQLVRHSETVKAAVEFTTRQTGSVDYSYYDKVAFNDISSSRDGGAIEGSTITLSDNGSVTFCGNSATASVSDGYTYVYGGAIYGGSNSTITLSDNGSVTFCGNSATASASDGSAYVYGGAIYGGSNSTITLSNNGSVTFCGNSATASASRRSASAYGGAIYGGSNSTITLSDNGSVTFCGNSASGRSAYGGAIYGDSDSTITLSNNGSVTFCGNSASGSSAYGGAIYGSSNSTITLSDNGSVTFSGNSATASASDGYAYVYGGAIWGSTITLSDNGSVTFSGNSATASVSDGYAYVYGGAIWGSITLSDNGSVTFSGNSATASASGRSAYVYGGAIGGSITLSDNGSVTFSGNSAMASASRSSAYGGAIYGSSNSTITLSDNGSVAFCGNSATASASRSSAYGGAIYAYNLSIQNNDSVLFEKNAEITNGTYRLRSIYAGGIRGIISLSAAEGKSIEFRDSVYIASGSTVELNADYTNSEGNVIKQEGDIIFTGAYAETHLNELLTAAEAGRTATAEEIANSRLTVVNTETQLYGGCLRVEDGAIYQGHGLTTMEGSGATVRIQDAELNHCGYDLTFNSGTSLELVGDYVLMCSSLMMKDGSTLLLDASTDLGICSLSNLTMKGTIQLTLGETNSAMENVLLMCVDGEVSGWTDSTLTLNGSAGNAHVTWVDNHLVLNYNASTYNKYFNGTIAYSEQLNRSFIYRHYQDISFTSSSGRSGGAIEGSITLSYNGSVTFCENSATEASNWLGAGGAICGNDITLSGNESVNFSENKVSCYHSASGGAIHGSNIMFSKNGEITFFRNSSYAYLDGYHGPCADGGAIGGSDGNITFRGNRVVTFCENSSTSEGGAALGGAIWGSTITLSDNGSVTFCGNSATASASGRSAFAYGGAIEGSTITLSDNGSVTFSGNSATASASDGPAYVYGGAIRGSTTITLSDNGSVTFSGNSATASVSDGDAYVYGGAIYGSSNSTITLNNNGSVTFSGNSATASASDGDAEAYGGAIYAYNLSIQNNDSVLFEKNAEITDGSYRLRSIYAGGNGDIISLSAAEGKSIEFRDSVYIASGSTVELNADYTNSEGNVIKQEGDIIFTGAYAETHLNELLTAAEAGRTATAEEIANSRTSEMHGKVTLYGGTLRVEEQAVLKTTAGLEVAAGSTATVKVSNAELDADSSDINVGDSGTLTLMNGATVKAANINIADGATFAVVAAPSQEAVATFSLREAASVAELPQSCLVNANLTLEAGSTLVADGVYFSMTEGSTLTFKALTGGDKINLVLTLGAEYSDNEQVVLFSDVDVVRFVLDGVELSTTDSLLANTFFTGAWVNDETTLSYDRSNGTISLQHLNTVTVPEPTTATLSLLALAALAARRRRASC